MNVNLRLPGAVLPRPETVLDESLAYSCRACMEDSVAVFW